MSKRELFKRNGENVSEVTSETIVASKDEDAVVCDTAQLKKWITRWTQHEGWKFDDFATFAELVGLKTPIKLSEWNGNEFSCKCSTAINTEVKLSIRFGDGIDNVTELWVTDGEETRRYRVNYNLGKEPKATLYSSTITRDSKVLNNFYNEYFCIRMLELDEDCKLEIEIWEGIRCGKRCKQLALRNCVNIEEYLLSLDCSLDNNQVYDKLIELLDFSEEDLSNCIRFSVMYCNNDYLYLIVDKE